MLSGSELWSEKRVIGTNNLKAAQRQNGVYSGMTPQQRFPRIRPKVVDEAQIDSNRTGMARCRF